jgi:hypothetical protein
VDRVEAVERQHLVHSLEAERKQFPEVEFEVKLVRHHRHAGRALIEESADADLLVVGRGRGGRGGVLHGSVTRSVVEDAKCPVAVVRRQTATNGGMPAVPSQASQPSRGHLAETPTIDKERGVGAIPGQPAEFNPGVPGGEVC